MLRVDFENELQPLLNAPINNIKRNKDAAVNLLLFGNEFFHHKDNFQRLFDLTLKFIVDSKRFDS